MKGLDSCLFDYLNLLRLCWLRCDRHDIIFFVSLRHHLPEFLLVFFRYLIKKAWRPSKISQGSDGEPVFYRVVRAMQLSPSLLEKEDPELTALGSTEDWLPIPDRYPIVNYDVGPLAIFANVNSVNAEFVGPFMRVPEKSLHSHWELCQ